MTSEKNEKECFVDLRNYLDTKDLDEQSMKELPENFYVKISSIQTIVVFGDTIGIDIGGKKILLSSDDKTFSMLKKYFNFTSEKVGEK